MDLVLQEITNLAKTYGFAVCTIVVLTMVATNLTKKPIVKMANKFVEKMFRQGVEVSKSVYTSNIMFIPLLFATLFTFLYYLILKEFDVSQLVLEKIITEGIMNGMLTIATYRIIEKKLESYCDKRKIKEATIIANEMVKTKMENKETDSQKTLLMEETKNELI